VLGYIATTQSSKVVADVQMEYGLYKSYYPTLDGVFFDEGTSWVSWSFVGSQPAQLGRVFWVKQIGQMGDADVWRL
jgi:hypothetical protein